MKDDIHYEALRKNSLFSDLSDEQLDDILQISKEIILKKNTYLIREGDLATEFFIVLEGEIEVIKTDPNTNHMHRIGFLTEGDTLGELALLDKGKRSASARSIGPTRVLSISFEELRILAEKDSHFHKITLQIAKNLSLRLRNANEVTIQALEKQLDEYRLRVAIGKFMVDVVVALCLFTYALSGLTYLNQMVSSSTMITLPLTLSFVVLLIFIMKHSKLPMSAFGLTTHQWRPAVFEAVVFSFVIWIIALIYKWILIHSVPSMQGHPLIEPYAFISVGQDSLHNRDFIWWTSLLSYWFLISPIQELIARGGLQGPLEIFMPGKYSKLNAVVISNLMFSTVHLFFSVKIAVLVFFGGLYFGWLYSRHRTLIGVIIAHAMVGSFAFWIVGI